VDFWWDQYTSNTGDCWFKNQGADGTTGAVTGDPPAPPVEGASIPGFLPEDCDAPTDIGTGNPQKEAVLGACAMDLATSSYDSTVCDWFSMPPKPSGQSQSQSGSQGSLLPGARTGTSGQLTKFCTLIGPSDGGTLACSPFQHRP